ncbi:hypothetical protein HMPREF0762_00858 [Slackia exigua ATCC 700122]|uniref:Uncharacterized protein n=1 Tax=Slackia exigua (strain ATCC 700122 / DSM 15923 / CIP 105133 / JCM 11022 / KCTC 5966 / S-7) TaxID=649764 RepID=D0WGA8_SLAES|nr:hypothetical protein HMPREF0762_00858 [Slackia exigua ATCC 700122]
MHEVFVPAWTFDMRFHDAPLREAACAPRTRAEMTHAATMPSCDG